MVASVVVVHNIMLTNYLRQIVRVQSRANFATAVTRDQVDYYSTLEVQSGATEQAIRAAYAELTNGLNPKADSSRFKQLSEAFVILTDSKTREAYDSLLKVRKSYYLSPEEETVPSTRSYLAQRRAQKLDELKKKMNIDEFGRYQGGLPQKIGHSRGSARAEAGVMHRAREIEEQLDRFPEFNNVTAEKAESFKNFHQDQREARQMKWPWFTFEVDYDYFTFRTFRKKYWPRLQLAILFFYILPTLYYAFQKYEKQQAIKALHAKAAKSASTASQHPPSA